MELTNGGNTQVVTFNVVAGPVLVAGGHYIFELLVRRGDSINFRYSTTGPYKYFRVQEVDSAFA